MRGQHRRAVDFVFSRCSFPAFSRLPIDYEPHSPMREFELMLKALEFGQIIHSAQPGRGCLSSATMARHGVKPMSAMSASTSSR